MLDPNGALHLPPQRRADSTATGAAVAAASAPGGPGAYTPEWRLLEGSDWAKRVLAVQRFTRAAWSVVRTLRLRKRLARINDVLGGWPGGREGGALGGWVEAQEGEAFEVMDTPTRSHVRRCAQTLTLYLQCFVLEVKQATSTMGWST